MTDNTLSTMNNQSLSGQMCDDSVDIGYVSKLFVQALFPYRATEETMRQVHQGAFRITVSATDGIPYGKYPRLIMAYLITQAVARHGQAELGYITHEEARKIPLGTSLNTFLRAIGLKTRGGGSVISNLRTQIEKITACSIKIESIARTQYSSRRKATPAMEISNDHELWFSNGETTTPLKECFIALTPTFYKEITESPIPIDLNVLTALGKPRAMDMYIWITLKKYWVLKRGYPSYTFSWDILAKQFSPQEIKTPAQMRDFREHVKKCITSIQNEWHQVEVSVVQEGLTIYRGPLPVQIKLKRQLSE
ncbi:Plasmid encoded RepA protein (plasmid) [Corynebacterium faecale]|uniref:replication protein RepA n=1 Tax=Corynebacterium faecale TaxID=1758466 RepID=UPI0025B2D158|nr:replication protein RepA [Corynebacterium faecale]WJY93615.1 Plasmid encoded RepA protein [Corynebacterium faecale]